MGRNCDLPLEYGDNPWMNCARADAADYIDTVQLCMAGIANPTGRGNIGYYRDILKDISQNPVDSFYYQFDFCLSRNAVFGSGTPMEVLHAWYLGLMKLALVSLFEMSTVSPALQKWYISFD